jgi:uncharacterized membrane protein
VPNCEGQNTSALHAPAAVERITRHPFFVGMALFAGAPMLLASTLASAIYFGGFVVVTLIGIPLQDRKLHARYGKVYAAHLSATSAIPFAMGRSLFDGKPVRSITIQLVPLTGAIVFANLHWLWKLGHGAPFAVLVVLGGVYAVVQQIRKASRVGKLGK